MGVQKSHAVKALRVVEVITERQGDTCTRRDHEEILSHICFARHARSEAQVKKDLASMLQAYLDPLREEKLYLDRERKDRKEEQRLTKQHLLSLRNSRLLQQEYKEEEAKTAKAFLEMRVTLCDVKILLLEAGCSCKGDFVSR
jgi:hypothetical protein